MDIPTLPAPPRALASILEAASDPDVRMQDLAEQVAMDPSFATMVLKVANTARYLGSRKEGISDVRQATMRLGVRSLRNFALCHTARSCASSNQLVGFDLDRFWEDSLRRAVAGELLAESVRGMDPSTAFTLGLLQELGVVAMVLLRPDLIAPWYEIADLDPTVRLKEEKSRFGVDHTDVAAQLARDWELPEDLALPLSMHHDPDSAPEPLRASCRVAQAAELLASVLASTDKRGALERARRGVTPLLTDEQTLEQIVDELGERVQTAAAVMGIAVGAQPKLEEILQAANKSLVDMNLSYEDLVTKLERVIAEKDSLAEQLDERNRALEKMAITDTLTGLPNRRELFRRTQLELKRVARHGSAVAMVVADIDHFKRVNDTWGHVFGDKVLIGVANTMADIVRANDLMARTGGEEFAALLPRTGIDGATILARRILKAVAELRFTSPKGESVQVTVSLGIAWVEGSCRGGFEVEDLITRLYNAADHALYASKDGGRNRASRAADVIPWHAKQAA